MKRLLKYKLIAVLAITTLCTTLSFGQPTQNDTDVIENIRLLNMEIVNFERPIVYYTGNKENRSYTQALVMKFQVDYKNYLRLIEMSNMPLLYIDKYRYSYFAEENGEGKNQKILTFHIVNWQELKSGMPISYSMNHQNPHAGRAIKFNPEQIKNRQ